MSQWAGWYSGLLTGIIQAECCRRVDVFPALCHSAVIGVGLNGLRNLGVIADCSFVLIQKQSLFWLAVLTILADVSRNGTQVWGITDNIHDKMFWARGVLPRVRREAGARGANQWCDRHQKTPPYSTLKSLLPFPSYSVSLAFKK